MAVVVVMVNRCYKPMEYLLTGLTILAYTSFWGNKFNMIPLFATLELCNFAYTFAWSKLYNKSTNWMWGYIPLKWICFYYVLLCHMTTFFFASIAAGHDKMEPWPWYWDVCNVIILVYPDTILTTLFFTKDKVDKIHV